MTNIILKGSDQKIINMVVIASGIHPDTTFLRLRRKFRGNDQIKLKLPASEDIICSRLKNSRYREGQDYTILH